MPEIESLRKKTTRGPPFGKLCRVRTRKAYRVLPNLVTLSPRDVRFNENRCSRVTHRCDVKARRVLHPLMLAIDLAGLPQDFFQPHFRIETVLGAEYPPK